MQPFTHTLCMSGNLAHHIVHLADPVCSHLSFYVCMSFCICMHTVKGIQLNCHIPCCNVQKVEMHKIRTKGVNDDKQKVPMVFLMGFGISKQILLTHP